MKGEIAGALSSYRSGMERIRSSAAAYKDEDAYIRDNGAALAADTRQKIAESEKGFSDFILNVTVPALREALVDHMTQQPDNAFMQTLTYYQQFNVKLSRDEVKALAYDAAGNSLALRCLSSIAEKSGINVSFPTVKEYSGIIDRLEKMAQPPLMFCPPDFLHEGIEVFPDRPLRRADGSIYGNAGRPDSVYLLMQQQSMEATMKAADEAGETWSKAVVPEISEYEIIKTEDGEEVSRETQRATDKLTAAQQVNAEDTTTQQIAATVTAEQKEAEDRAARGRAYYFGG